MFVLGCLQLLILPVNVKSAVAGNSDSVTLTQYKFDGPLGCLHCRRFTLNPAVPGEQRMLRCMRKTALLPYRQAWRQKSTACSARTSKRKRTFCASRHPSEVSTGYRRVYKFLCPPSTVSLRSLFLQRTGLPTAKGFTSKKVDMSFAGVALLACLVSTVSAHFHLEYPGPRGPFNMPNELTFCG